MTAVRVMKSIKLGPCSATLAFLFALTAFGLGVGYGVCLVAPAGPFEEPNRAVGVPLLVLSGTGALSLVAALVGMFLGWLGDVCCVAVMDGEVELRSPV